MPSTYTQNLGIERPATGEQANIWGLTVNRNMDTLDIAINGNTTLPLSTSPYQLLIDNGETSPVAANPLIIWTGPQSAQGTVQIDWQSSRQHLYIMNNKTSGGFGIAFAQGSGTQFVLQAGHDAVIYADGGGPGASVASALANPQFDSLLVTGNAQVNGTINGILTSDAQGNARLTGGLGVNNPSGIPDPLTVYGYGNGGQLRLVAGGYGVMFRNDGTSFYLMVTAAGDPYGGWDTTAAFPLWINLATKHIGMSGWGPDATYVLNVPTIHTSGIVVDGGITAGQGITVTGGIMVTGGIGLEYGGSPRIYFGADSSSRFLLLNAGQTAIFVLDQSGNAQFGGGLLAGGIIHANTGGFMFPDGSIQDKAARGLTAYSYPGYALNSVYRNNNDHAIYEIATLSFSGSSGVTVYSDAGNPPGTQLCQMDTSNNILPLGFWVLPGHYFRVQATYGSVAVAVWMEWT